MTRQNPRARVEALAESLLDSERDITITDARRHLSKLADTDVEYAAAKYLQEAVNRNRRSKRREAEKAAQRRVWEQNLTFHTAQADARAEQFKNRRDQARRRAERDPMYTREVEEADRHRREYLAWSDLARAHDATSGPFEVPLPEVPRTIVELERDGEIPATWRSKKFDDYTPQDWDGFHDHGALQSYDRENCYLRLRDQYQHWKIQKDLDEKVNRLAEEKLLAWTEDLLAAEFRLSDGTLTTWGSATIEQHRERVEMFSKNAAASVMGAGRHLQAVQELEAAKASTLNDLVAAPVAA